MCSRSVCVLELNRILSFNIIGNTHFSTIHVVIGFLFLILRLLPYFCRMIEVCLLGAGNVATHLYQALNGTDDVNIIQCYNRKGVLLHPNQDATQVITDIAALKDADVYIVAVSDDAIAQISDQLPFQNRLVVHTSGSVPMTAIAGDNRKGVFYPLQTFSKDKSVEFNIIPICIEAEETQDLNTLKKLASLLSDKVYEITSAQRNVLHVSAVFVNNFTNHLYTIGTDICDAYDVPFEILHPLIQETAKKILEIPAKEAQTGPAIRNDQQTIARHLKIMNTDSQKEIYTILTKAIQSKHGKKL